MLAPSPSTDSEEPRLDRALGPVETTCIVLGTVLGAGVFLAPGAIARTAGSFGFGAVLLVWLVCGLVSLAGALSFAELAAMFPRAGGQYVYLRETFGSMWAFLYGWAEFWVARAGAIAVVALLFAQYAGHFTHQDGEWGVRWTAFIMILAATAVNYVGVREAGAVQVVFTALKVAAIGAFVVCAFALPQGKPDHWEPLFTAPGGSAPVLLGTLGLALAQAMWCFFGWARGGAVAEEMKSPQRDLPRAHVIGTLVVGALYLTANAAFHYVLPTETLARSPNVATQVALTLFGPLGAGMTAAVIMIAAFGSVNGLMLTGPRVSYAMAKDGLFFRELAAVHPRFRTPYLAVLFQGLWAALIVIVPLDQLVGRTLGDLPILPLHAQLLSLVMFASWGFAAATVAGLIVLRRTRPELERPFRVPGYPWVPGLFVLASAAMSLYLVWWMPAQAVAGTAVILLGLPAYWWWSRKQVGTAPGNEPGIEPGIEMTWLYGRNRPAPVGDSQALK